MKSATAFVLRSAAAAGLLLGFASPSLSFTPASVECIAPSAPGGGWDFTCRTIGKLLYDLDLVPSPVRTSNVRGGTGANAFGLVATSRSAEDNLVVATSTMSSIMLAQDLYPGDIDTMRWVATLGTDLGVVLVGKDSPFNSLNDLVEALKQDPTSVRNAGAPYDHMRLLMIAKAGGVTTEALKTMRSISFEGCANSVTAVLGGHVDMTMCDMTEVAGFIQSGDVKVLAVLSDERAAPPFDQLPTAREQGIDVVGYNWRGFYVGGDVSDEAYNGWIEIFRKVYESPEWEQIAKENGLQMFWRSGDEFKQFVSENIEDVRELTREVGMMQ